VEDQPRIPLTSRTPAVEAVDPPASAENESAAVSDDSGRPATTDATAAPKRSHTASKTAIEWFLLIVAALVIAVLIKAFLFQAFYIPSDSMVPTLKTNDRVIVNKLSYHLHKVHRGDVVVFTTPKGPDGKPIDPTIKDLVKRVIGLPGDIISYKSDRIVINGKFLKESYLTPGTVTNCQSFQPHCFPSGRIPENRYFVMGDNRQNSRDSRYFGAIPRSEIVGRVFVRVWPLNRLAIL
jgi:signal peptidase I